MENLLLQIFNDNIIEKYVFILLIWIDLLYKNS